ncbi:EpsG family protein, partial [Streptococcus pyogenes]
FNYLRSFCFVAQYVALATFFVGFTALLKKKWIPAAILIVLAVLLHQSAIIVVPFVLMYFMRTRWMMVVSILLPVFAL